MFFLVMHRLSAFLPDVIEDGNFEQTQFANSHQLNSLCFAANKKYLDLALENPAITAVLTTPELVDDQAFSKALATSPNPEADFYALHNLLFQRYEMRPALIPGIDPSAQIHPSAFIDPYTRIAADVVIGPGAAIMSSSVLEAGVVIGPNAVIGADGHFFKKFDGRLVPVEHAGGVALRKGSQVLAGAVVSKSLHTDFTELGVESVVSVKSHIAHGCSIGTRTIIAGSSQVSGYSRIGDDCWVGPGVTVGNMLKIGNNVTIEAGSVVITNLEDRSRVSGNYALPHFKNMMDFARRRREQKK